MTMRIGGFLMLSWMVAGVMAGPVYLPITGPTPIRFRPAYIAPVPLPPLPTDDSASSSQITSGDDTSRPDEEYSFPQPPAVTNIVTAGGTSSTTMAEPGSDATLSPDFIIPISSGSQGVGRTTNLMHLIVRPEDLGLQRPAGGSDVSSSRPEFIPAQSRATYESKPAP